MTSLPWGLMTAGLLALPGAALAEGPAPAAAAENALQDSGGESAFADLGSGPEIELEDDLRTRVVTAAAKQEQTVNVAPGVVEVITAEEIEAAGYSSVGEALMPLAGIVVYNDLVHYNVAVRGIAGGERSGSRIVKVLIDGQPIAYRASSANFLGPEMIPIELVERIEIIRGPGSVLYGANAFLGGINVVTKSASSFLPSTTFGEAQGAGMTLSGGGQLGQAGRAAEGAAAPAAPGLGGFGSLALGAASGDLSVVAGTFAARLDRSGLALPRSSPRYGAEKIADSGLPYSADPYSQNDLAQPRSSYARLTYRSPTLGRVRVFGSTQTLHSQGEFQDRNTLSHDNTVWLNNAMARVDVERGFGSNLVLRLFGAYSEGSPGDHYVVKAADPGTGLRLETGYQAVDTGVEASATVGRWMQLLAGVDFTWDEERTPIVRLEYLEDTPTARKGTLLAESGDGRAVPFRNVGGYTQMTFTPFYWAESPLVRDLGVTGGARYENNSVYGPSLNWRGGLVVPLGKTWYVKALGGSSFKGPSAEELYAIPLLFGDPVGNPALNPQTATTVEGVVGYTPSRYFAASAVGYYSMVRDQIRYRLTIAGQIPENLTKQDTLGVELQVKVSKPFESWKLSGFANATILSSRAERPTALGDTIPVEPDLYPPLTANLGANLRHKPSRLGLYLEARFLGPRPPSHDNEDFWLRGADYELPAAVTFDAALGTEPLPLGDFSRVRAQVRVTNLLDADYALPGFHGFDVPGVPRTFTGSLEMDF